MSLSCHYDPNVSQYGCVKISGNALMSGYYDVEVNLLLLNLSALTGTENILHYLLSLIHLHQTMPDLL